jgi:hypothetical protein
MSEPTVAVRKVGATVPISADVAMEYGLIEPSPEFLERQEAARKAAAEWAAHHCDEHWDFDEFGVYCTLERDHGGPHLAELEGDDDTEATITWGGAR